MRLRFAFGALTVAVLLASPPAAAYCRTTTCTPPGSFVPTATQCEPAGLTSCSIGGVTVKDVPLWWKNKCVSYDVQQSASKYVTLDQATQAADGAFATWSGASCTGGTVTISGKNLGPVACTEATFNLDGANQNVIVFRDTAWPYKTAQEQQLGQASPTIALTTVSFNSETGEILDSDVELNTEDHQIIITDTPKVGVYDLQSVLTHESGHFLGIAHTPVATAVMYFEDEGGSSRHRELTADDTAAICDVYPPSGIRPVDTAVDPSGGIAAGPCDATPRGGLSTQCDAPAATTAASSSSGCAAAPGDAGHGLAFVSLAGLALAARRRRTRATFARA